MDEIKFQEDGTWCPMRPKKDAVKIPTQSVPKVDSKYRALHTWQLLGGVDSCICESCGHTALACMVVRAAEASVLKQMSVAALI